MQDPRWPSRPPRDFDVCGTLRSPSNSQSSALTALLSPRDSLGLMSAMAPAADLGPRPQKQESRRSRRRRERRRLFGRRERLLEVGEDVVDMLDANGEAHIPRRDACGALLSLVHLGVGG